MNRICSFLTVIFAALCLLLCSANTASAQVAIWSPADSIESFLPSTCDCADSLFCMGSGWNGRTGSDEIYRALSQTPWGWDRLFTFWHLNTRTPFFHQIVVPNKSLAMNVGDSGTVLRTTNGGTVWDWKHICGPDTTLVGIALANASTGMIIGSPPSAFITRDSGATWKNLPLPLELLRDSIRSGRIGQMYFHFVNALSPTHYILTAARIYSNASYLETFDAGTTWNLGNYPEFSISRPSYCDSLHGYCAVTANMPSDTTDTLGERIIRTTDGGHTWFKMLDRISTEGWYGRVGRLTTISALDTNHIIAGGLVSIVDHTVDGGQHWFRDSVTTNQRWEFVDVLYKSKNMALGTLYGNTFEMMKPNPKFSEIPLAPQFDQTIRMSSDGHRQAELYFDMAQNENVSVTLYNAAGEEVAQLLERLEEAGPHHLSLNLSGYSTGMYFCQIRTATGIASRKILVE